MNIRELPKEYLAIYHLIIKSPWKSATYQYNDYNEALAEAIKQKKEAPAETKVYIQVIIKPEIGVYYKIGTMEIPKYI